MTKIKMCGLSRPRDVEAANEIKPDYVGFVFAPVSKRAVTPEKASELKKLLSPEIIAVGVFVDEAPEKVAALLNNGIIDMAQLHGGEDGEYIKRLKKLSGKPLIKAFRVKTVKDVEDAEASLSDHVLLDSGAGSGSVFDWNLVKSIKRQYFLAGGLDPYTVGDAVRLLRPFAVDVSSGIETDGVKDKNKMAAFMAAVRSVNDQ